MECGWWMGWMVGWWMVDGWMGSGRANYFELLKKNRKNTLI